jgi:hypothetical protein
MADASKPVQGQHAQLVEFETAVYGRRHENRIEENDRALKAMKQCLVALREGAHFVGEEQLSTASLTRMASAIVALFSDPEFVLTQEGFNQVAAERQVMETLFKASIYDGSDFVIALIQPGLEKGLSKYLLLQPLGSRLDMDWEAVFRMDPQATIGLYLSLVGYGQVFTKEGHERREKLLALAPLFEDVRIPDPLYNTLCGAYMHCSYASGRDKHACKRVFHKIIERMLPSVAQVSPGPRTRSERPRVLILFEWWWSKHAMFRSYARSIRQLRKDFYLIGSCAGKNTDAEAKTLFDEWIELDGANMVLANIANRIKQANPDIIYYPSVGMAIWVIAMASLRLAPIQVMTYGHPATSNSPHIDYGIIEADCCVEDRFSEKMVTLPPNTVRPTEYEPVPQRHVPRKTDVVRIGVAAMQVKVSWPFVRAMQEVQKRAKKKVEFYFFSATHGVGLFSMCRDMGALLENVTIQEKQNYNEYMESLHQMDIALFSFPFGGANSTYDAVTLGLPMVSLEGDEPHSRSDASIIRRCGLPESLIAKTEAEYVDAVLALLDDDRRAEVAHQVRAVDLEGGFYAQDESDAFLNAFRSIYRDSTVERAA